MKALKIFSVACCMAAVGLTSCIGDDNNNSSAGLTPSQIATCLNAVRGSHSGKMYYYAPTTKNVNNTDSAEVSWTITTDSTMTIHDFPARALAQNIDSVSNAGKELRAALQAAPDQDIECYIGFIKNSPIYWLINPKAPTYTVKTSDGEHKIQVAFYANNTYSSGFYNTSTKEFSMEIVEGAIYMDGNRTSYLTTDTPIVFIKK
jgi:hypothetical protein